MRSTHSATSTSSRVRSGPSDPTTGWRVNAVARYVSTTGAEKHTACHPGTSMTTRICCELSRQCSPGRYRCHDPDMRMWVCSTHPSSHPISRCFPRLSTRSMTEPGDGTMPSSRGAWKAVVAFPISADRRAAAVRWIVSPSGTTTRLGPPAHSMVARCGRWLLVAGQPGLLAQYQAPVSVREPGGLERRRQRRVARRDPVHPAHLEGANPAVLHQVHDSLHPAVVGLGPAERPDVMTPPIQPRRQP